VINTVPVGLARFCELRSIDMDSWQTRGKLRLKIDTYAINVDPIADNLLRLSHRLRPLPTGREERENLVQAVLLRVAARATEQTEMVTLTEETLCVEQRVHDAANEVVVTEAVEAFVNAVAYWRSVVKQ
jgi:hypothetical protein